MLGYSIKQYSKDVLFDSFCLHFWISYFKHFQKIGKLLTTKEKAKNYQIIFKLFSS